jgi:hypothetical protein
MDHESNFGDKWSMMQDNVQRKTYLQGMKVSAGGSWHNYHI